MPVQNANEAVFTTSPSGKHFKRELILVFALKLLLLLSIRVLFFPHRIPTDVVESGLQERMLSHPVKVPNQDRNSPNGNESEVKDKL